MKLGQAASSEFYSAWGEPGRQRAGELNIVEWDFIKFKPWHTVLRAKSESARESIASAIEKAVANMAIGYSQNNGASPRTTLWDYASKVNFDIALVEDLCNCDCSSLVAVAVRSAGVHSNSLRDMYTGNMVQVLKDTGAFSIFTDDYHCQRPDYLVRGDILVRNGHTAVALETAQSFETEDYAIIKDCAAVNLRTGPAVSWPCISTIKAGNVVNYFSKDPYTGWLQVGYCGSVGYTSPLYSSVLPKAKATGNVYLRYSPVIGRVLNTIPINGECSVIGQKKVCGKIWYNVCYKGEIGWASSMYVKPM